MLTPVDLYKKFVPINVVEGFEQLLTTTRATVLKDFPLILLLTNDKPDRNDDSLMTQVTELQLSVPIRSKSLFQKWMNEMQTDVTKSDMKYEYRFKNLDNSMLPIKVYFIGDDLQIQDQFGLYVSAYYCYYEAATKTLFAKFADFTKQRLYQLNDLPSSRTLKLQAKKIFEEQKQSLDKFGFKEIIVKSKSKEGNILDQLFDDQEESDADFNESNNLNDDNNDNDGCDSQEGINFNKGDFEIVAIYMGESETSQGPSADESMSKQYIKAFSNAPSPPNLSDLKTFFIQHKRKVEDDAEMIKAKQRRNHEALVSVRKLSVLDDKTDKDYTQHVSMIYPKLVNVQKELNQTLESMKSQLRYIKTFAGDSNSPRLAQCGICKERSIEAAMIECGHVFCIICVCDFETIGRYMDDEDLVCPYCQKEGDYQQLFGVQEDED